MKISKFVFAGAALALSGSASFAANAKVCFEAEKPVKIESPLKKVVGKGAGISGGGYLEIPWDENKTKGIGEATFKFNVKKAGTYYLWARTFWANGCGNSILASVNGGDGKILGEDGTYDAWHWVGGRARVSLKAGVNTLTLKNRETGVRVDQFFLCQDGDYTPVGERKVTK
ncbi:MAG TPA: hypothetical protein VGB45_06620 [Abditibacterium sp.]|jgi:hypothetical protein